MPVLLLLGVERVRVDPGNTAFTPLAFVHYPITHSAAAVVLWSLLFAATYFAWTRYRAGAVITGLLVASHWLLDFVTHRPDLPLWPGGPKVGLGLWRSIAGTLIVELAIFAAGVAVYITATRARTAIGRWALAGLVAILLAIYAANQLGPLPPNSRAIGGAGLAMWFFVAWGAWIDRNREIAAPARGK